MAKSGRKRKAKPVTIAGGPTVIEALNKMEREKGEKIMHVALTNPLRRQYDIRALEHPEWLATALGRLCTVQKIRAEVHDAANDYATVRRSFRAAIDAPIDLQIGEGMATSLGPSRETISRWRSELDGCKGAILAASGHEGFVIFERLVIDDSDLPPPHYAIAQQALLALAIHMGKTSARVSAFA